MSEKNNDSVQKKLEMLTGLVEWFQGSDFTLEQSAEKFTQAEKLAEEIEGDLTKLKNDIQVVQRRFDRDEA